MFHIKVRHIGTFCVKYYNSTGKLKGVSLDGALDSVGFSYLKNLYSSVNEQTWVASSA